MNKSTIHIVLLLGLISGCQTLKDESSLTSTVSCEDQLADISSIESQVTIIEKSKQAGGYVLSYGASATGYAADALVFVAEGVVKSVVYCPAYVVSVALGYLPVKYCDPKDPYDTVKGTTFGKNIYNSTSDMRKTDYTPLSQAIRRTSECFASRQDLESVTKARSQLLALKNSELFDKLPTQEKSEVDAALTRLDSLPKP